MEMSVVLAMIDQWFPRQLSPNQSNHSSRFFLHDPRHPCGESLYAVSLAFLYWRRGFMKVTFLFLRYVNQGGNTALQDNESRLNELKERAEKLKMNKEAVSNEIDKMKNDISKQQVSPGLVHSLLRDAGDNNRRPTTDQSLNIKRC